MLFVSSSISPSSEFEDELCSILNSTEKNKLPCSDFRFLFFVKQKILMGVLFEAYLKAEERAFYRI